MKHLILCGKESKQAADKEIKGLTDKIEQMKINDWPELVTPVSLNPVPQHTPPIQNIDDQDFAFNHTAALDDEALNKNNG